MSHALDESPSPLDEPLGLEEELKAANPKGRLWEVCASRRVAPPRVRHGTSGPRHRVQMDLALGEWELTSGVQWGWSRKVAEQLAARELLAELAALEREEPSTRPATRPSAQRPDEQALGDDVFELEERDASRLRPSNPKGQLYEWCQRQKPPVRRPRFEARPARGATLVRGRMETLDLTSPWFAAARRKDAEQAAAEALLGLLPDREEASEAIATANPRSVLNEMVAHGELAECQVEVTGRSGPDHTPRFTAQGTARWPDGREVETEPLEGSSKRAAITAAASALLALVAG